MREIKLKPCPFCGGSAFTAMSRGFWHICHLNYESCFIDDCITGDYETEEEAIEAWNRRADNEQND